MFYLFLALNSVSLLKEKPGDVIMLYKWLLKLQDLFCWISVIGSAPWLNSALEQSSNAHFNDGSNHSINCHIVGGKGKYYIIS